MTTIFVLVTTICIGWSMWTRWTTWSCRWELASTVAVTLLGAGVVLIATPAWYYAVTFIAQEIWGWPQSDLNGAGRVLGHVCLILAAGAIAIAATTRLYGTTRSTVMRWVVAPVGGSLGVMMLAIVGGVNAHELHEFQAWYQLYVLALDGGMIYLLGYGTLALAALARDAGQRPMALLYAVPCGAGVMAHAGQLVLSWAGADAGTTPVAICTLVWIVGFALAATFSWNKKIGGFRRDLKRILQASQNGDPLQDAA